VYVCLYVRVCMYVCLCMCVCMYVCLCVCVSVCMFLLLPDCGNQNRYMTHTVGTVKIVGPYTRPHNFFDGDLSETYRSEVLLIYLSVPTVWDFSPLDGAFSHTSHTMVCMP